MKNDRGVLRIYLRFGNKETWKYYLKKTVISNGRGYKASLWTMLGEHYGYQGFLDEPPITSFNRLDSCIQFYMDEENSRDMVVRMAHMYCGNAILLADYFCENGEKLVFCYMGEEVREMRLGTDARTARMYEYNIEPDDNERSYVDRWITESKIKDLTSSEREFYRKIFAKELEPYYFEEPFVENRLKINFSNAKYDMTEKFIREMKWNDDLCFFQLVARIEAAVENPNTIDFSDICLFPLLARRLCLMLVEVVDHRRRCTAEAVFTANRPREKNKSFSMLMDKADGVLNVTITEHGSRGKVIEKKYSYRYDSQEDWSNLYEEIMEIPYEDSVLMDMVEEALGRVK